MTDRYSAALDRDTGSTTPARRELVYEILSGGTGLLLALFMWGHVVLVGSILTGERGFDWLATFLEDYYIAQPTVFAIFVLFVVHAALAARKIPSQLRERKRILALAKGLNRSGREKVATRTHLVLMGMDILTPLYGEIAGIESATSMARVSAGLWLPYAILLLCVEFHASVGLYRLAIKWGADLWMSRQTMHRIERIIFWVILGLGGVTLVVLAGWMDPPLAFLLEGGTS
jgi:fumarate reductase subunit C